MTCQPEKLAEIAEANGLVPVDTPMTITDAHGIVGEVFALGWEGSDLRVLYTNYQLWTYVGAYPLGRQEDSSGSLDETVTVTTLPLCVEELP